MMVLTCGKEFLQYGLQLQGFSLPDLFVFPRIVCVDIGSHITGIVLEVYLETFVSEDTLLLAEECICECGLEGCDGLYASSTCWSDKGDVDALVRVGGPWG